MKTKTILIALTSLFLLASCNGKSKQTQGNETQQTEAVDTNKIYDMSEVDTPPAMPR